MSHGRGYAGAAPVIQHGLALDEVLCGVGDCPRCQAPKLHPRRGWKGVLWCSGCGRSFAGTPLTEIDPVRGPEAWVCRGELVPPFVPAPPVPFAGRAPALEEADDDTDDAEAGG